MTSAVSPAEAAFGWLNEPLLNSRAADERFNNYGGEDRFFIGPECGQFGLWFAPGVPQELDNWNTPPGLNTGRFSIVSRGKRAVAMAKRIDLSNASGTRFSCDVTRTIRTLGRDAAAEHLGVTVERGAVVGFESVNTLANAGHQPWTPQGGLLSIWILGQFPPLSSGKIVIPFIPGDEAHLGPPVVTDYFSHFTPHHYRVERDCVLLPCDGRCMGKIGISPQRARNVLGSFDPDRGALTIVQFNLPGAAAGLPYVNSRWGPQDDPFAGDIVNAYTNGPLLPGDTTLGQFYELETSSPAAALPPGGRITHVHRTFHFVAPLEELSIIAGTVLGADLKQMA